MFFSLNELIRLVCVRKLILFGYSYAQPKARERTIKGRKKNQADENGSDRIFFF